MRGLSLFSGTGGLDLGARIAGAQIELASDIDDSALEPLEESQNVSTVSGDLRSLLKEETLQANWFGSDPDLMIGGPPCTAFSHAGFWLDYKRDGKDPAANLLKDYSSAVEIFRPRALVMENVPGLTFRNHREHLNKFLDQLQKLGYRTSHALLRASDFSVAQARRRLFVVGVRGGAKQVDLESWPEFPERTSRWAFDGLGDSASAEADEVPKGKYTELLEGVPPGKNYLVYTKKRGAKRPHFKYRGRYWSFLLKLDPDAVSPTIPAQRVTWNGPFHWDSRHLRIRELARLQSFPDSYKFSSDVQAARRHIGNAVPVLMGAAVVWRTLQALGGDSSLPEALERAKDPEASYVDIENAYPS